jgi:hypothetical protein
MHNEELRNFEASPNIIREIRLEMKEACSTYGRNKKYIKYFLKNLKGRGFL